MAFDGSLQVRMNGELVNWRESSAHISAHGLHYGSGVFEGIRCYDTGDGPAVFRLDDHIERLFASAATYGFDIPFTRGEMAEAVLETIRANGLRACYVRPVCWLGSNVLGLDAAGCPVEVAVLAWPWAALHGERSLTEGIRVTVSPWRKFPASALPPNAKACGHYTNSLLAVREARARGFDEAILLSTAGEVAEAAGENVFFVRNGRLVTNGSESPILLGITRDSVIRIARDLGIDVEVRSFQLSELREADEAFLTGTAAEIAPIAELDGEPISCTLPGPLTARIQEVFRLAVTARQPRYASWLAPVATLDVCAPAGARAK